jgi:hypothetical protein
MAARQERKPVETNGQLTKLAPFLNGDYHHVRTLRSVAYAM